VGLFYETEARKVFCEVELGSEEGATLGGLFPLVFSWGLLIASLLKLITNDLR
jgi:hypothetical protein